MRDNYLCVQNILPKIAPIERARESDRFRLSKLDKISKGGKVRSKRMSTQNVALRCTLFLVRDIYIYIYELLKRTRYHFTSDYFSFFE